MRKNENEYEKKYWGSLQQIQHQQVSKSELEKTHETFNRTIELLERYIELTGYYPDWKQRKQIRENKFLNPNAQEFNNLEDDGKYFTMTLLDLYNQLSNNPYYFREEIKQEYYNWIKAVGINFNNCHPRLKSFLLGLNEVLDERGRQQRLDINAPIQIPSENDWKKLKEGIVGYQNHLASLIKQRSETKDKISGAIEEVIRFKTWWSNYNVATVINHHNDCYSVFVVVYEPAQQGKSEILKTFEINSGYDKNSLESAKSRANSLRNELNGENPILAVHPSTDSYTAFSDIIKEPYVSRKEISERGTKVYIDWGDPEHGDPGGYPENTNAKVPPSDPDKCLKPLDLIKVGQGDYEHVGIYLGNGKVCNFSKKFKGTRIHSWREFFESYYDGTAWLGKDDIIRYRPIIPFKHYKKIIKQIAWAVDVDFRKNNYNLTNRNCEHFANMIVYGINYSEQIEENKFKIINAHRTGRALGGGLLGLFVIPDPEINNGKSSTIKLTDEINETNNKLGQKVNDLSKTIEALIEVPPKDNCRIM
ncbi:protein of unknown function [endosymbiont DhMRE of Dentiscutata heterogama]|uniref:lecithin retinol acyltransferase family protein n=1 Tax=endosymbiont DhMRE of Dentiscutata heterogama TaxID=1609546 RepID=UPI000629D7D5|nr:lecithin retinol acyltransferase family protein [endosymbiont DhMRE of Dentiscutata heterogama]CFW92762.1 protein of unknown function [endosymbiont DhMRE of Dentiscutata heterogama]